MDSGRLDRIKELLEEALRLPAEEREGFLAEACGGDEEMHGEVVSLLEHEETETGILDRPVFSFNDTVEVAPFPTPLKPGRRIGPYRVIRQIGRGGMGTVALAEREDGSFEKKVAVKVIRPHLLTGSAVRRFHNERQMLADLEHPNVARILDAGTTEDGLPYFVMEHVEGLPIVEHCERRGLPTRRRVEIFHQVVNAVHAAHQRLVVHRDLKPSNILVTDDGVPKLLDFGIAKRLDPGPETSLTRQGEHPMTLRYASPEQVAGRPLTTASDVYSLGVVLYELLTGSSPYPKESTSGLELARVIRDEEPRRPSTTLRQEDAPPAKRLARGLKGDLDAIVLKALRKEPERRYGSAAQLAEDLKRHLDGEPVLARRGTWLYRTGKFVRRNRWRLAAAAVGAVLSGTLLFTTAKIQRQAAERERISQEIVLFLEKILRDAKPDASRGPEIAVSGILRAALGPLDLVESDPVRQAEYLTKIANLALETGPYALAEELFSEALELLRQHHGGDHYKIAVALNNLGGAEYRLGNLEGAERRYREALEMKLRLGTEDADIAKGKTNLASVLMIRSEYDEAERLYREALEMRIDAYGREESGDVASGLKRLATLEYYRGDAVAAEPLLLEALEIRRRRDELEEEETATIHWGLGRVYHDLGHYAAAREQLERALVLRENLYGDDHDYVALARRDLAALLVDLGELEAAGDLLEKALDVLVRVKGEGAWEVAVARSFRGGLLTLQGRYDEAEVELLESYETLCRNNGKEMIYTRDTGRRLQELLLARRWQGRAGESGS